MRLYCSLLKILLKFSRLVHHGCRGIVKIYFRSNLRRQTAQIVHIFKSTAVCSISLNLLEFGHMTIDKR